MIWFGDKNKTLNYSPKSDEMILTVHRWFANKFCLGVPFPKFLFAVIKRLKNHTECVVESEDKKND